jgi:membrane-associated protein
LGPIEFLIDFILHVDKYIVLIIQTYGPWAYLLMFLVIFSETGLVIAPFFPGDSMIFVAGALANQGSLSLGGLFLLLAAAAIAGDTVNYAIGHFIGPRVFHEESRILRREYLDEAQEFFNRHGGMAIILARFVPFVRTFAPFLAGIGSMSYRRFVLYNIVGGVAWVAVFLLGGFFFGGLDIVKQNLSFAIIGIMFVSLVPTALKMWGWRRSPKRVPRDTAST